MDRIIVLEKGKITETGTYNELVERGEDFAKFLEEYATKQNEDENEEAGDEIQGILNLTKEIKKYLFKVFLSRSDLQVRDLLHFKRCKKTNYLKIT